MGRSLAAYATTPESVRNVNVTGLPKQSTVTRPRPPRSAILGPSPIAHPSPFEVDYGAKYPKAVAKIVDDADVLLEFYKYPAEHWIHLRTTTRSPDVYRELHQEVRARQKPTRAAAHRALKRAP